MEYQPRYYFDMRDMLGNEYSQSGVGLKLVQYIVDSEGIYQKGDPSTSGIILAKDIEYENFFDADIESSGLFDLYLHKSDTAYVLLREYLWLAGKNIDATLFQKKLFLVGAGDKAISSKGGDQPILFNARNYDSTVEASNIDGSCTIISETYEPSYGAIRLVVRPTYYAAPQERTQFMFAKGSTGESVIVHAYII